MNYLLMSLLLTIGTLAMAQKSQLRTRISNDEKALSIQIDGHQHGRKIHFDETFDITNKSDFQQELIKYRVYSSLGLAVPIHEMPWTVSLGIGVILLSIILLVVRFRTVKTAHLQPRGS